jgi:hypothetical protein
VVLALVLASLTALTAWQRLARFTFQVEVAREPAAVESQSLVGHALDRADLLGILEYHLTISSTGEEITSLPPGDHGPVRVTVVGRDRRREVQAEPLTGALRYPGSAPGVVSVSLAPGSFRARTFRQDLDAATATAFLDERVRTVVSARDEGGARMKGLIGTMDANASVERTDSGNYAIGVSTEDLLYALTSGP